MENPVPYMLAVKNLSKIFAAMQKAATPETFTVDFLKDLGFTSSNDRGVTKMLRYIGYLDPSGKPTTFYREAMDKDKAGGVLARRLAVAYDDLFNADREAHTKKTASLKGWFKTKTGQGDSVAEKIAATFKALADIADFSKVDVKESHSAVEKETESDSPKGDIGSASLPKLPHSRLSSAGAFGLVYRVEIHLPDTQNVDTFRAIFKALREELM